MGNDAAQTPEQGDREPRAPSFLRRHLWLLFSLPLVLLVGLFFAGWYRLAMKQQAFTLTLELKTPQGSRNIRVTGTEITLEEIEHRTDAVITNCELGLLDFRALSKLARDTLSAPPDEKKKQSGAFTVSFGDDDGSIDNSGALDATQGEILADFIVKRAHGCVTR